MNNVLTLSDIISFQRRLFLILILLLLALSLELVESLESIQTPKLSSDNITVLCEEYVFNFENYSTYDDDDLTDDEIASVQNLYNKCSKLI